MLLQEYKESSYAILHSERVLVKLVIEVQCKHATGYDQTQCGEPLQVDCTAGIKSIIIACICLERQMAVWHDYLTAMELTMSNYYIYVEENVQWFANSESPCNVALWAILRNNEETHLQERVYTELLSSSRPFYVNFMLCNFVYCSWEYDEGFCCRPQEVQDADLKAMERIVADMHGQSWYTFYCRLCWCSFPFEIKSGWPNRNRYSSKQYSSSAYIGWDS